jgi:hypothetical protein
MSHASPTPYLRSTSSRRNEHRHDLMSTTRGAALCYRRICRSCYHRHRLGVPLVQLCESPPRRSTGRRLSEPGGHARMVRTARRRTSSAASISRRHRSPFGARPQRGAWMRRGAKIDPRRRTHRVNERPHFRVRERDAMRVAACVDDVAPLASGCPRSRPWASVMMWTTASAGRRQNGRNEFLHALRQDSSRSMRVISSSNTCREVLEDKMEDVDSSTSGSRRERVVTAARAATAVVIRTLSQIRK